MLLPSVAATIARQVPTLPACAPTPTTRLRTANYQFTNSYTQTNRHKHPCGAMCDHSRSCTNYPDSCTATTQLQLCARTGINHVTQLYTKPSRISRTAQLRRLLVTFMANYREESETQPHTHTGPGIRSRTSPRVLRNIYRSRTRGYLQVLLLVQPTHARYTWRGPVLELGCPYQGTRYQAHVTSVAMGINMRQKKQQITRPT